LLLCVAFDSSGNLFVADTNNNKIKKIDASGLVTTFAIGLKGPVGIAFDSNGNLYVAETGWTGND